MAKGPPTLCALLHHLAHVHAMRLNVLKCKPSAEILEHLDWKHQLHAYVLGIYRTSFQHNLHGLIDAGVHVVNDYTVSNIPVY